MTEGTDSRVRGLILASPGPLAGVRSIVASDPDVLKSSCHWGGGDWETAIDAVGHLGHADVAMYLADRGMPLQVYAAASMGQAAGCVPL